MKKQSIYSLPSPNQQPKRLFDILEDIDGFYYLEMKRGKEIITVPLEYVRSQMEYLKNN